METNKFLKVFSTIQASLSLLRKGEMKISELSEEAYNEFSELEYMLRTGKAEIRIVNENPLDDESEESKALNIFNTSKRTIKCVRNDKDGMMPSSHHHHLLEVGKEYSLVGMEVNSWYTLVRLAEFPGITFNSVVFEEVN